MSGTKWEQMRLQIQKAPNYEGLPAAEERRRDVESA
jgi:hypothetical protein